MPPTNEVEYGSGWGGDPFVDLTVPSGAVCRVKRSDPLHLLDAGVLDDVDTLSMFVQEKHVIRVQKGKKVKTVEEAPVDDQKVADLMRNPETRRKMLELMNAIAVTIVVTPQVHPVVPVEDRVDGLVYVDTIPLADRAAILRHAVGDVKSLERFRRENSQPGGDS